MPGMDGIEATRIIREEIGTEYAKKIPIIALTANAIVGNEEMFLSKGFQAYISKPIELPRLDAVIRQWVQNKELEKTMIDRQITIGGETILDSRIGVDRRSGKDRRQRSDRRSWTAVIAGLDIDKGIKQFSNNRETYMKVLQSFASNTLLLIEAVKVVNESNLPDYAINIHGIKGSCRGIFAEEAGNQAEALEKAARAGNLGFIKANNQPFIEALLKLVADIQAMLERKTAAGAISIKEKPVKEKPDMEILSKLLAACENFKITDIERYMKEIENYEYNADEGLVSWLRENVVQMNYPQIAERLRPVLTSSAKKQTL